jgi:hypothetical protein
MSNRRKSTAASEAAEQQFVAAPALSTTKGPAPRKSEFPHIEYIDVNDDGVLEEVAVVKKWEDGSLSYILVSSLGAIDKARLLKIVTSGHSSKYELWDLMTQIKLSNGMNALDFFHQNLIKMKRAKGSVSNSLGSALRNTKILNVENGSMIGSEFTDPSSASLDGDVMDMGNVV